MHTKFIECVFEVGEVLHLCDVEIVVRELILKHVVCWICGANTKHGRGTIGPLRTSDLTNRSQ